VAGRIHLGGVWARGAAYAGFRPPTLNELHRPFRVGNDITEANPLLTPETLWGVEVGLSDVRPDWSLTVFYNELQDPITNVTVGFGPATFPTAGFVPAGGVLRQRRNAGAIEAWGLEADIDGEVGPFFSWRAAVAATRARVDGGGVAPQLTGKRPAQTPEVTATAGIVWGRELGPAFNADLRYESERFEDDLNSRKLAAALSLDLRLAWRLDLSREVYLMAENVLDREIEVGETADGVESYAAPRTIRVGFSLRR
jgi:outer membrane receptor protein involved in Fe transport